MGGCLCACLGNFFLLRLVKALQRSEQDLNKRSCQVVFFCSRALFFLHLVNTRPAVHITRSLCVYVFTGTTHERDCVCHYEILKVGVFALSDRPATANGAVRVCMCMCVCVSHEMRHFMAGADSQLLHGRETQSSQYFREGGLPPELSLSCLCA